MSVRPGLALVLLGAVLALLLVLQGRALAGASERRARAESLLASTLELVREKALLEARREEVSAGRRPDQDVIARVNATLSSVGLDPGVFRGQQPEADAKLPKGSGGSDLEFRRQSVRLSLASLSPSQIGRFLAEWRARHAMWTPVRIDLSRRQGERNDAPGRYDATIVVAAVYLESPTESSPPAAPPQPSRTR